MAFALASALVALACALASARRLAWASAPMALDAALLANALTGETSAGVWRALRRVVAADARLEWESALLDAFAAPDATTRVGLVNERLMDLDGQVQRWARVPRVCVSIATSAGFFFALIALLGSLAAAEQEGPAAALHGALASALGALVVGIAGASFCAAAHVRAARVLPDRLAATGRLTERLEALASAGVHDGSH